MNYSHPPSTVSRTGVELVEPQEFRFSLKTALEVTALTAFGAAVLRYGYGIAFIYWFVLAIIALIPRVGRPQSIPRVVAFLLFQLTYVFAVHSLHADPRLGVTGLVAPLMVCLFGILPATALALPWRWFSVGVALTYAVFAVATILPQKAEWDAIIQEVHEESDAIIAYANYHRSRTGSFPSDLSGYTYLRPEVTKHIHYSTITHSGGCDFWLDCWITGPLTTYAYGSGSGWCYDAD